MHPPGVTPRENLARYVARQAGVVSREQLAHCGFTPEAIKTMRRKGELIRLHEAVFAVGHVPLARRAHHIAALLAAGREAVLSHHSAAEARRLPVPYEACVHVSVPRRTRRRTGALAVHKVRPLSLDDRSTVDGLRVTGVPRTLLDLADALPDRPFERVVAEAQVRRLLDPTALAKLIDRSPGRRTARLAEVAGLAGRTRSEMERELRRRLRAAALPLPESNVRLHGWEVDACWPARRLVVELDGWRFHDTKLAIRTDRRKDRSLRRRGFEVLRFTWDDLVDGAAIDELAQLLGV